MAAPSSPPPSTRSRAGLAKSERLRRHNDFLKVERSGARVHGAYLTLVMRPGRGRVGFTVSKKVSLSAVVRNRVRRRLKEIVRKDKGWIAGQDVVIIAKPESATRTQAELQADLESTRERLQKNPSKDAPRRR